MNLSDEEKQKILANAGGRLEEIIIGIGELQVNSEPANAKTYIDDLEQGDTPFTLQRIASGWHELILIPDSKEYKPWYGKHQIKDQKITIINIILEKEELA